MNKRYAVVRQVGKRRSVYAGKEGGQPVYKPLARAKNGSTIQTYSLEHNARRRALELESVDNTKYWNDSRRQIGDFQVIEVPYYW